MAKDLEKPPNEQKCTILLSTVSDSMSQKLSTLTDSISTDFRAQPKARYWYWSLCLRHHPMCFMGNMQDETVQPRRPRYKRGGAPDHLDAERADLGKRGRFP